MNRRDFLQVGAAATLSATMAGCMNNASNGETVQSLPRPTLGATDSSVVVKVFEDYMCPHCRKFDLEVFPKLKQNYIADDTITYDFYDFPIPVSQLSYPAAIAARSVQDNVGEDAFWTFKTRVFKNQNTVTKQRLAEIAADLGADKSAVYKDIQNGTYRPVLEDDRQTGQEMGVKGTPFVFVNGEYVKNPVYPRISDRIDQVTG